MTAKDSRRLPPLSARMTAGLMPMLALAAACLWSSPAAADFRLCNNTSSRVGIALGYKDAEGWTTEGWWNVSSRSCETLLRGTLVARYYYIYALDYDRGGEWSGQAFMCSRDKEFTIKGTENCLARGYDRTGFFEVDTGEQRAWTVQLTEANEQPGAARAGNSGHRGTGRPRRGSRPVQSAERTGSAASPGAQAMRRLRRIKILATLGPASSDSAMIRKLFEAGADVFRINMSHTSHDKMRELVSDHPQCREQLWPADRHPGRPAGAEAAAWRVRRRLDPAQERPEFCARFRQDAGRQQPRAAAASGNPRSPAARPCAAARRRQGAADRRGNLARARGDAGGDRRQDVGSQGRQPARYRPAGVGDDAEGPRRSRSRARDRGRLDRALLRAARRGRQRSQADDPRPRRRDGQDRKAAGDRPARRDHRGFRRADGGARRSRRRTAAGAGAEPAEADDADGAPRRQAGGDRDADAGVDDPGAGADARGSLRRRDRRL